VWTTSALQCTKKSDETCTKAGSGCCYYTKPKATAVTPTATDQVQKYLKEGNFPYIKDTSKYFCITSNDKTGAANGEDMVGVITLKAL